MELTMSSQSSLPTTWKSSLHIIKHHHIQVLALKWKAQMMKMIPRNPNPPKEHLVHVVKEGETLTCIAKMYGVSIKDIAAANKDIVDLELVFHGQHLNILPSFTGHKQMTQTQDRGPKFDLLKRNRSSDSCNREFSQMSLGPLTYRCLPYAKTTGYFLVLVPLIAFCIRCIMGALCNNVPGVLGRHAANESKRHHPRPKRARWKVALRDLNPDIMDSDLRLDYDQLEIEDQQHHEDLLNSSPELQRDYQKFLSECGMSKRGYWRGGSD